MTKTKKVYKKIKNKTCKITNIPSKYKDINAIIDINAVKHNIAYLKKQTGTDLMPVLKADAYGHGLIEMARILRDLGIQYIGVATVGEAILLRKSGDKGRILFWLYDIDGDDLKDSLNLDLDIGVFDEKHIPKIKKWAPKSKKIKITIFVDTGLNRAGIPYSNALQACKDVAAFNQFEFVGLMSHLICSEIKNSPIVNDQLRKFRELRKELANIGIIPQLVHIANTGGCLNYDVSDFTLSRPGSGIYGVSATKTPEKGLKLAMSVKTHIIQTKTVEKGEGIGYYWKYIVPKKMKIGILPIGYADIIPRTSLRKLYVYVNGSKRKVLGTISMDQIVIEMGKNDKTNDDVYIFGDGKNCKQTVFDLAKEGGSLLCLEILCHIGYRVNRTYINI